MSKLLDMVYERHQAKNVNTKLMIYNIRKCFCTSCISACEPVPRPYGATLECTETGYVTECEITCRDGKIKTKEYPLSLKCGSDTGYIWEPNMDLDDLPSCSGNQRFKVNRSCLIFINDCFATSLRRVFQKY